MLWLLAILADCRQFHTDKTRQFCRIGVGGVNWAYVNGQCCERPSACKFLSLSLSLSLSLLEVNVYLIDSNMSRLGPLQASAQMATSRPILTSLCSASYVDCERDTARWCCLPRPQLVLYASARRSRSISYARRALSSKPAGRRRRCCWLMGQTDGRSTVR